jgi:hypothetical protein
MTKPGTSVWPPPSMIGVPAGMARRAAGAIAAIRPSRTKTAMPRRGAAPVPSISSTLTIAKLGSAWVTKAWSVAESAG